MKKLLYVLSFILDITVSPLVFFISFCTICVLYIKDKITGTTDILELEFGKDYFKPFIEFIKNCIFRGLKIHKERLIG